LFGYIGVFVDLNFHLNFHHLRYFWWVAKTGSMTAAANRLGLRAQTLSTQIAQLEQSLGRALFQPVGRGLGLTEAGRVALRYADQIFQLGQELAESLADESLDHTVRFSVGITDALPKRVAFEMLAPTLALSNRMRLLCTEGRFELLCAELAAHRLDVILAERPAGGQLGHAGQWVSQALLSYPVWVFGAQALAAPYQADFPASLHKAPFLMPARNNMLRAKLEQWLETVGCSVQVVGEFEDMALLETCGRAGMGLFAVPAPSAEAVLQQGAGQALSLLGQAQGLFEAYFALAHPRNLKHPAVQMLLQQSTN
jgi:LysR family transcriptional activator of nhaA